MKHFSTLCCWCILAVLSGCGVRYVPLMVKSEPEITFSKDSVQVLVINRFDVAKADFLLGREKKKEVFAQGIRAEIQQVTEELERMKGLRLILPSHSVLLPRDIKASLDSSVLTVSEIQQLAKTYQADYILSLEDYEAKFVQDEVNRTKNADGSVSKVATYSLSVRSAWVWYDPYGQSFKELQGDVSAYHSERGVLSGILALGPALGTNARLVVDMSKKAGARVAAYFKVQNKSLERPLYNDREFRPIAEMIRKGAYSSARKELQLLAQQTDRATASKAYYSLAVLADLEGNRSSAIDFATLSLQKKRNMYATMLLNGLKES